MPRNLGRKMGVSWEQGRRMGVAARVGGGEGGRNAGRCFWGHVVASVHGRLAVCCSERECCYIYFKMTSLVVLDEKSKKPSLTALYILSSLRTSHFTLKKIVSHELPPPCPESLKHPHKQGGGNRGNCTRDGQRKRRPEPRKKAKQQPPQRRQLRSGGAR